MNMTNNEVTPRDKRDVSTHPQDSDIERNRVYRWVILVCFLVGTVGLSMLFGALLSNIFFELELLQTIFFVVCSMGGSSIAIAKVESWFIVRNPTTGMFVTIDQLRSLLGKDETNVYYGPGTSIAYPWETRISSNNISLEEAANEFTMNVQCVDGVLTITGSYRMRPNPRKPVAFLTGVAAVASDIQDLIKADVLDFVTKKKVGTALKSIEELNAHLRNCYDEKKPEKDNSTQVKRVQKLKEIEKRFGIDITDATVSSMLPSEDVQKSMSAITEAVAIKRGTGIILGLTQKEIKEGLKDGSLTQADINLARDRFLSISGNLEGMEIKRNEYDISVHGINPKMVDALAGIMKSPAALALAANAGKSGSASNKKTNGGSKK